MTHNLHCFIDAVKRKNQREKVKKVDFRHVQVYLRFVKSANYLYRDFRVSLQVFTKQQTPMMSTR